jgi:hypothetical protein
VVWQLLGIEIDGGWVELEDEYVRCGGRIFEDRAPFSAYHWRCGAKPKVEGKIRGFLGVTAH